MTWISRSRTLIESNIFSLHPWNNETLSRYSLLQNWMSFITTLEFSTLGTYRAIHEATSTCRLCESLLSKKKFRGKLNLTILSENLDSKLVFRQCESSKSLEYCSLINASIGLCCPEVLPYFFLQIFANSYILKKCLNSFQFRAQPNRLYVWFHDYWRDFAGNIFEEGQVNEHKEDAK